MCYCLPMKDKSSERFVRLVDEMIDAIGKERGGQADAARILGVSSSYIPRHRPGPGKRLDHLSDDVAFKIQERTGILHDYFFQERYTDIDMSEDWRSFWRPGSCARYALFQSQVESLEATAGVLRLRVTGRNISEEDRLTRAIELVKKWKEFEFVRPLIVAARANEERDDETLLAWADVLAETTVSTLDKVKFAFNEAEAEIWSARERFTILMGLDAS